MSVIAALKFVPKHLHYFLNLKVEKQGEVGFVPSEWVKDLDDAPSHLPSARLNRDDVFKICQNKSNDLIYCYICVMAWGGQGAVKGGRNHVKSAWAQRNEIVARLQILRDGNLSREAAYNLFCKGNKIDGLGPAYWTKLLYFFSSARDHYILDQWTAKSINLLTGLNIIQSDGSTVSRGNKSGNYLAYCEEVDCLATILKISGDDVEHRLVSAKNGDWRRYVQSFYGYNKNAVKERYQHLAKIL